MDRAQVVTICAGFGGSRTSICLVRTHDTITSVRRLVRGRLLTSNDLRCMTIPKEAIEKALAGGWRPDLNWDFVSRNFDINQRKELALDPAFWQALIPKVGKRELWYFYAEEWFDRYMQGKDIEGFWRSVLGKDAMSGK